MASSCGTGNTPFKNINSADGKETLTRCDTSRLFSHIFFTLTTSLCLSCDDMPGDNFWTACFYRVHNSLDFTNNLISVNWNTSVSLARLWSRPATNGCDIWRTGIQITSRICCVPMQKAITCWTTWVIAGQDGRLNARSEMNNDRSILKYLNRQRRTTLRMFAVQMNWNVWSAAEITAFAVGWYWMIWVFALNINNVSD